MHDGVAAMNCGIYDTSNLFKLLVSLVVSIFINSHVCHIWLQAVETVHARWMALWGSCILGLVGARAETLSGVSWETRKKREKRRH